MRRAVGLDFGTTNSTLAVVEEGVATLATFPDPDAATVEHPASTFRSMLYFSPDHLDLDGRPRGFAGPWAICRYLESSGNGRLIQSMKSHLASRLFTNTSLFGRFYTLEDLIAIVVRALREAAESQFGDLGERVVVGRPAHFAGADTPEDDQFAVARLRAAFEQAGFTEVEVEFEPVAAAYQYEQRLDHDELVLIGDFGGGTSDFSLIQLGPSHRYNIDRQPDMLGVDGVPIAGDAFDSTLVRHVVAPHLGLGSRYRTAFGQRLPVPLWIYHRLERWEHLSFLKSKETMESLNRIRYGAESPESITALIHLINDDLGYRLYRSIEQTKVDLSAAQSSAFAFRDPPVAIDTVVPRVDFEEWLGAKLHALESCIDRLLARANVSARCVDSVFLTGGSSFVPAVRRLFAAKFGTERLRDGEELTTVARGLALRAR